MLHSTQNMFDDNLWGLDHGAMAVVGCGELVGVGGGELSYLDDGSFHGVTFVDTPPNSLSDSSHHAVLSADLTVCQYILPQDVAVSGFEEVVEEVELGCWDNLNKSSSSSSLSHDSGIGSDPTDPNGEPSPDVFLTLIEETVTPASLLTASPSQDGGGEVIVERIYEMKDDLCFNEATTVDADIKDEPSEDMDDEEMDEQIEEHTLTMQMMKCDGEETEDSETTETAATVEHEVLEFTSEGEVITTVSGGMTTPLTPPLVAGVTAGTVLAAGAGGTVRVVAYHCSDCKTNFTQESDFRDHMQEHLIKLQNSCALCSTEFSSKSELQEHIKDHFTKNSTSSHKCSICSENFVTKSGLKRHKKQLHSGNSVVVINTNTSGEGNKCSVCLEAFSDKTALRQHVAQQHATRKPFTCQECGATFTQNGSLQVHLRRHRGEKPFSCQLCGNSFTRAHSLKVHMKTHTGEKPYACEYCGACFVTSSHLTVHRRTHTGERPYSCGDCGATFITTSHLNVHRRVHTGTNSVSGSSGSSSNSVSCGQCSSTFKDASALRSHRRTHHRNGHNASSLQSLTCKVCHKQFSNHSQLGKHLVHECA
ncbi:unnamed protein product, partial [Meganyctiphanes norvegica]